MLSDVYFSTQSGSEAIVALINKRLWNIMSDYLQKYADSITLEDIVESYKESTESQHSMPMYYI